MITKFTRIHLKLTTETSSVTETDGAERSPLLSDLVEDRLNSDYFYSEKLSFKQARKYTI